LKKSLFPQRKGFGVAAIHGRNNKRPRIYFPFAERGSILRRSFLSGQNFNNIGESMKTFLVIATLISPSAFAASQPDFTCVEESGFEYKFFNQYGEIHVKTDKGEALDHLDGLRVKQRFLKSNPVQEQFTYVDAESGNNVAVVTFVMGEKTGQGEMLDNDQAMACTRQ
jgi:hypothetical protein